MTKLARNSFNFKQSYYTSKNSGEIGNIFVNFGDFPKKSSDNTVLNSLTVFRRRKKMDDNPNFFRVVVQDHRSSWLNTPEGLSERRSEVVVSSPNGEFRQEELRPILTRLRQFRPEVFVGEIQDIAGQRGVYIGNNFEN